MAFFGTSKASIKLLLNLITILFPRVGQLYSRFGEDKLNTLKANVLRDIKAKCREHQMLGYNEL